MSLWFEYIFQKSNIIYRFGFQYIWLLILPSSQEEDTDHKIFSIHLLYLRMQPVIPAIKFPADPLAEVEGGLPL